MALHIFYNNILKVAELEDFNWPPQVPTKASPSCQLAGPYLALPTSQWPASKITQLF